MLAIPCALLVVGRVPVTSNAGVGHGQRCGVHQASLSAAVEAKRSHTNTVAYGGVPKDGVLPLEVWYTRRARRAGVLLFSSSMQYPRSSRPDRADHAGKGGDAKPPTSYVQIGASLLIPRSDSFFLSL